LRDASGDRPVSDGDVCRVGTPQHAVAAGLHTAGLLPGMKIVLMVRHGIDFITLVYGLFKAGAVLVMIDPGMGMTQMLGCLRSVAPDGFTAIPAVQTARSFCAARFREHG
jgi:non-ribosomal peptide synthetase component E (peptide arylation enzyme)